MKSKYLNIGLSILVAGVLVGCGSSSGGDGGGSSEGKTCTSTPLANYQYDATIGNNSVKLGANGSLTYEGGELELTGVDSLSITKVVVEEEVSMAYTEYGTITATITQDTDSGVEHIVGNSSLHGDIDCTTTYDITMPVTVNNSWDLENITDLFTTDKMISTTCEDWVYDDSLDDAVPTSGCTLANYTITDSSNELHYISEYFAIASTTVIPDDNNIPSDGNECITFVDLTDLYQGNMIALKKGNIELLITIGEENNANVQYAIDGTVEWQSPFFKYAADTNGITFTLTEDEAELLMTEGLGRIMPPQTVVFVSQDSIVKGGDNVIVNGVEYPVEIAFTHVTQALDICPIN